MPDQYKLSNKVREKSLVSLSVYNVGMQRCEPGYQWGPGVRDHYLIHYVVSGQGSYTVHGQTYALHAGDAFLVFPDMEVSYRADLRDPWEYRWVGFAGSDAAAMIESSDFGPHHLILRDIPFGHELEEKLAAINNAFGNSFANSIEMTGELYLALGLFVTHSARNKENTTQEVRNVRRAVSYIDSRYSYDISIEDVAAYTAISRSTLYRQFMKCIGIPPKQYLEDLRIRRARTLLEDTDLTVSAIAISVGVQNALYFSKMFRKSVGCSPSQYRDRKQGK